MGDIPIDPNSSSTAASAAFHQPEQTEYNDYTPKQRKLYTLVYPIDFEKGTIVLGYKKRGFGVGKCNGYGGKVEPYESIPAAASRELFEESTLTSPSLLPIGILFLESIAPLDAPYHFPPPSTQSSSPAPQTPSPSYKLNHTNALPLLEIHVYLAPLRLCTGTPTETEEMRPEVFTYLDNPPQNSPPHIPYDQMWSETVGWLPEFLSSLPRNILSDVPEIKYFFLHHALFIGGYSPNTGKWDPWENIHGSGIYMYSCLAEEREKWQDEGVRGEWVEGVRRRRMGDNLEVGS